MVNKNLIYNDILFNKLKKKTNILNVGSNQIYDFTNVSYTEFENLEGDEKFDYIIFFDLFSRDDAIVKSYLKKTKNLFKENGYVLIINIIITSYSQYAYHPFSYLQRLIYGKPVYLTDIDDMLREDGYKIINMSRLYSINWIPLYPIEFFSLIIKL